MNHRKTHRDNRGYYFTAIAGLLFLGLTTGGQAQQPFPYDQTSPVPQGSSTGQISPCRQLGKGHTVVIIEASNDERLKLVNQVVNQHNLQGQFCASRRTGRKVWMSSQLSSVNNAVQVFDYFKAVGLVSPVGANQNNNLQRNTLPTSPTPSYQN